LRESHETNLPSLSPIDSASPESRTSVRADPTRYNPNLSDDEPLFSARMGNAQVLADQGSLPASEIATVINGQKLYTRADGCPVPGSQISARARKYPDLLSV
jgi:hypothetical protein